MGAAVVAVVGVALVGTRTGGAFACAISLSSACISGDERTLVCAGARLCCSWQQGDLPFCIAAFVLSTVIIAGAILYSSFLEGGDAPRVTAAHRGALLRSRVIAIFLLGRMPLLGGGMRQSLY